MFQKEERPIVAAIHPSMIRELKLRKELIETETKRKARGGITCFSEMAAMELSFIRKSGEEIYNEITKLNKINIKKININGVSTPFVPYDIFKKLYIITSILKTKKDNKLIQMEITKIKGLKKNEIKYLW